MNQFRIPNRIRQFLFSWFLMIVLFAAVSFYFPELNWILLWVVGVYSLFTVVCIVLNWRMRKESLELERVIHAKLRKIMPD